MSRAPKLSEDMPSVCHPGPAGKRHVPFHARRPCDAFQLFEQRARAADHQPRIRMQTNDLVHRFDDVTLTRERVQAFDVQQQVRAGDAERGSGFGLGPGVVIGKSAADRRVDRFRRAASFDTIPRSVSITRWA